MDIQAKAIASLFSKALGLSFEALFYKAAFELLSEDPDTVFWLYDYGEALVQRSQVPKVRNHLRLVH